ncbi:L-histidine N(alpha)-methyltransferase [Methylocystis sp. IM3]|uniref:L-histidine N(alpha)-methyltransferase n=1 Tax=unclassified Methylocystis TaxID=2625913 RepID=UPI0031195A16
MSKATESRAPVAPQEDFAASVAAGLSQPRKSLPCRFFYDDRGSALFEEITRQPEYYLTRTEADILDANVRQMLEGASSETVLVEFGSGSSVKTEILIRAMGSLYAYAPIDISESALADARRRLTSRFSGLDVRLIPADFSVPIDLPPDISRRSQLGFFPGSTIGNFAPLEAARVLDAMRETLSSGARLIVGVDLKKDVRRLLEAYDDAEGVTAAFDLNLLTRINRELGGKIDPLTFSHAAIYDSVEGRVEMHLVSRKDQLVDAGVGRFAFRAGETIHTENAYKHSIEEFQRIARRAGWRPARVWTDAMGLFSLHELIAPRASINDRIADRRDKRSW